MPSVHVFVGAPRASWLDAVRSSEQLPIAELIALPAGAPLVFAEGTQDVEDDDSSAEIPDEPHLGHADEAQADMIRLTQIDEDVALTPLFGHRSPLADLAWRVGSQANIVGVVVRTSAPREVQVTRGPFASSRVPLATVVLADEGCAAFAVTFWREQARLAAELRVGQLVRLSHVRIDVFQGATVGRLTRASCLTLPPSDDLRCQQLSRWRDAQLLAPAPAAPKRTWDAGPTRPSLTDGALIDAVGTVRGDQLVRPADVRLGTGDDVSIVYFGCTAPSANAFRRLRGAVAVRDGIAGKWLVIATTASELLPPSPAEQSGPRAPELPDIVHFPSIRDLGLHAVAGIVRVPARAARLRVAGVETDASFAAVCGWTCAICDAVIDRAAHRHTVEGSAVPCPRCRCLQPVRASPVPLLLTLQDVGEGGTLVVTLGSEQVRGLFAGVAWTGGPVQARHFSQLKHALFSDTTLAWDLRIIQVRDPGPPAIVERSLCSLVGVVTT